VRKKGRERERERERERFNCGIGFLHSDPHCANAFIRPVTIRGRKRPQLVLLGKATQKKNFKNNFFFFFFRSWIVQRAYSRVSRQLRSALEGISGEFFLLLLSFESLIFYLFFLKVRDSLAIEKYAKG
jgi:hypothetical protein